MAQYVDGIAGRLSRCQRRLQNPKLPDSERKASKRLAANFIRHATIIATVVKIAPRIGLWSVYPSSWAELFALAAAEFWVLQ